MKNTPPISEGYELVIRPNRGWFAFDWKELHEYRDLLWLLVRRDFVAKYKQTILGPAWFVLQPLLTTAVFVLVFGNVVRIPTEGAPPALFYLAGLLGWNYFAQTFQGTSATLLNNAYLFGKVYFPRMVVPLSTTISNVMALGVQALTYAVCWAWFQFFGPKSGQFIPGAELFLIPLVILQIGMLALGCGLWMSALTARYRDLQVLSGFLVQLWMFGTPVIYPLSRIPEKWQWVSLLNPMTMPVEAIKKILLNAGQVSPPAFLISTGVALLLFLSGALIFHRVERNFIDTV